MRVLKGLKGRDSTEGVKEKDVKVLKGLKRRDGAEGVNNSANI